METRGPLLPVLKAYLNSPKTLAQTPIAARAKLWCTRFTQSN